MPRATRTNAGHLTHKVTLQKRTTGSDGYGNVEGDFADQFTVKARIDTAPGSEAMLAARLTGKNMATITVRRSANTALIVPEWRLVDARTGELWNVRSVIDPDDRRMFFDMVCEKGVAT